MSNHINLNSTSLNVNHTFVDATQINNYQQIVVKANTNIKQSIQEVVAAQKEADEAFSRSKTSAELLGRVLGVDIPESIQSIMAGSKLLGPALELAFPVTEGIAFGQMLVDATEKSMEFYYSIRNIADYMQTDWLSGLSLYFQGYGEKIKYAEKVTADYLEEGKSYRERSKSEDEEIQRLEMSPVALANKKHQDASSRVQALTDKLKEKQKALVDLTKRSQATESKTITDPDFPSTSFTYQVPTPDALQKKTEVQPATAEIVDIQSQLDEAKKQERITSLQLGQAEKQEAERTKAARLQAEQEKQQELIRVQESGLLEFQAIHGKSALQETNYWQSIVETARKGTDSYQHALDAFNQVLLRSTDEVKQIWDERNKALEENAALQTETKNIIHGIVSDRDLSTESQASDALRRDSNANKEWADSLRELNEVKDQNSDRLRETSIGIQKQLGLIADLAAAKRKQALHAEEYRREKEKLDQEQILVDAEKDPLQKRADQAKLDVRREKLEGQHRQQGMQDAAAVTQALAAPYINASRLITNSYKDAVNEWLRGSQTFSQAMQHAWQNIAMGFIENIEKMGQKWLEKQIMMTVIHQAEKAKQITTEEAADMKSELMDSQSSMKKLSHAAAVDAGKVYGAFADIPIVGPVLGAAAAAGTYASIMALASFDVGTPYVPRTGIAMIHEGERIFTAADNKALMQMMLGGGKGSSDTLNVNHTVNMNGYSDAHFQRALSRNADHVFGAIQKSARRRGVGA